MKTQTIKDILDRHMIEEYTNQVVDNMEQNTLGDALEVLSSMNILSARDYNLLIADWIKTSLTTMPL